MLGFLIVDVGTLLLAGPASDEIAGVARFLFSFFLRLACLFPVLL